MNNTKKILDTLFDNKFDLENFKDFVGELFNQTPKQKGPYTIAQPVDGVKFNLTRLELDWTGIRENEQIDIIIIEVLNGTKNWVEKARTKQRNIISNNLKTYSGAKTHILTVFYRKDEPSWRLSYVKQDFKFIKENGKIKATDELTPAKRFSFFIDPENSHNITVKKNFEKLMDINTTANINDIENAFSVEAVTQEFFDNYKKHYLKLLTLFKNDDVFKNVISSVNQGDENFAENFVKKLMGQIVFLYFVQKKGRLGINKGELWGDGSKKFIRELYQECINGGDKDKENGGINFFNDYLEWLFYATLNKNRGEDNRSDYFKVRIPYLNGGLFEPINGYIWDGPEHIIFKGNEKEANEAFGELLDFFDLYNFTVYENDPLEQDVAVDPEMLGKIFENLLPENERKGKGSFYTPREIVHYMCKESIKEYLVRKTGLEEERIETLIKKKDSMETMKKFEAKGTTKEQLDRYTEFENDSKNIDDALSTIKIIDPAVGSGAFPMGILKEIVSLRTYIQRNIFLNEDKDLQYKLKKQALENNIYGVDIDPGAVDIAKLRFWLSLIIENDSQEIEPLPNLDYKIMQGNSLLDQLIIGDSIINIINDKDLNDDKINKKLQKAGNLGLFDELLETSDLVQKIKFFHKKYFLAKDATEKKNLKNQIDEIEKKLIRAGCEEEISKIKSNIDNIENKKLIGIELNDKDIKELKNLEEKINGIRNIETKFEEDHIRPFFPWKLHFGDVFKDNGGFDIVIGNPPYVQLQKNKGELGNLYQNCGFESFVGTGDIYCLFYEKGFQLLKKGGILAYITSNKWMRAGYGENLRNYLSKNTNPLYLIDLGPGVFETATVDTNIFIGEKEKGVTVQLKGLDLTKEDKISDIKTYYNKSVIISTVSKEPRTILSNIERDIKEKIEKVGTPLKDWDINIYRGILTGCNEAFIIDGKKKDELIKEDPKSAEIIRPILRGRDIKKYRYDFADLWIINAHNGIKSKNIKPIFINDYPAIKKHLDQYWEKIEKRDDQGDTPYNLRNCAYMEDFSKPKLSRNRITSEISFSYGPENMYYLDSTFFITGEKIKYILGVMNSKLLKFWIKSSTASLGEGSYGAKIYIEKAPIIKNDLVLEDEITECINKILNNKGKIDDYEKFINENIYKAYGLSNDEIKFIENI